MSNSKISNNEIRHEKDAAEWSKFILRHFSLFYSDEASAVQASEDASSLLFPLDIFQTGLIFRSKW